MDSDQIQSGKQPQGSKDPHATSTDTSMMSMYQPQNDTNKFNLGDGDDEKKNLWRSLLQSVGQRSESRPAHILVLGDRNAGKRSLIKAMNKPFMKQLGVQVNIFDEMGSDYSLFESSFLYARDIMELGGEEGQQIGMEENLTRLNVWVISEEEMCNMIPKVLSPEDLEFTFAIIVPDLEQPWDLMNQCEKWMNALMGAIYQISPKLKLTMLENLKERIEELYKTYKEPELDKDGKLINKKIRKMKKEDSLNQSGVDMDQSIQDDMDMMDDLRKQIDLPEGVLVTNIFIPSAVVCSKVDLIEHGEKEIKQTLEQNIDWIQYCLRKFCLNYGSSLMFASANSGSNIQILYDYILSRLYDSDFIHPSRIDDKEALFVPTGFDSPDLISQMDLKKVKLQKNTQDLDEIQYNDIIKKQGKQMQYVEERKEVECPSWKQTLEIAHAEKEQKIIHKKNFLGKIQGASGMGAGLQRNSAHNVGQEVPKQRVQKSDAARASVNYGDTAQIKQPAAEQPNGVAGSASKPPAEAGGDAANRDKQKKDKVKDFYSNLLNKKKSDKIVTPKQSSGEGGSQAPSANPKDQS